jgi:hypothetical protein
MLHDLEVGIDIRGGKQTVGARDHDDGVLPVVRPRDVRDSAGSGHHLNRVGIDAGSLQPREQPLGKEVGAERRNHVHRRTQLGDGYRLVGALASVENVEAATENRLARGREAIRARHQVDVDAAHYQQPLLHVLSPVHERPHGCRSERIPHRGDVSERCRSRPPSEPTREG